MNFGKKYYSKINIIKINLIYMYFKNNLNNFAKLIMELKDF